MTCDAPHCTEPMVMQGVCSAHWLEADEAAHGADRLDAELVAIREDEERIVEQAAHEWMMRRWKYGTRIGGSRYQRYLESREWALTRALAIHRADRRCQVCAAGEPLEVHHKTYARLGHERDDDLIVLCADCHAAVHDKPRRSAFSYGWRVDWSSRW